jgi:hypothetical protein
LSFLEVCGGRHYAGSGFRALEYHAVDVLLLQTGFGERADLYSGAGGRPAFEELVALRETSAHRGLLLVSNSHPKAILNETSQRYP